MDTSHLWYGKLFSISVCLFTKLIQVAVSYSIFKFEHRHIYKISPSSYANFVFVLIFAKQFTYLFIKIPQIIVQMETNIYHLKFANRTISSSCNIMWHGVWFDDIAWSNFCGCRSRHYQSDGKLEISFELNYSSVLLVQFDFEQTHTHSITWILSLHFIFLSGKSLKPSICYGHS